MRSWAGNLNKAQHVVLSIGVAVALLAIGRAAESAGSIRDGGWFAYSPLTGFPESPFLLRHPGLRLLMWLVLISIWVALSLWLFRRPGGEGREPDRAGTA